MLLFLVIYAEKASMKLNRKRSWIWIYVFVTFNEWCTDTDDKVDKESDDSCLTIQKQRDLQPSDEMKMHRGSKGLTYSEIQTATDNFSSDNLLGEDGYGLVYKGELEDGQLIAVKVQNEANTRGSSELHSQLCVLSLACHKNVVMLLGYCRRENINILVYEYICNRSLEWHLFGE